MEFVDISSVGFHFLIIFVVGYGRVSSEAWQIFPCVNEVSVFRHSNDVVQVDKALSAEDAMEFQGRTCGMDQMKI